MIFQDLLSVYNAYVRTFFSAKTCARLSVRPILMGWTRCAFPILQARVPYSPHTFNRIPFTQWGKYNHSTQGHWWFWDIAEHASTWSYTRKKWLWNMKLYERESKLYFPNKYACNIFWCLSCLNQNQYIRNCRRCRADTKKHQLYHIYNFFFHTQY